MIRRVLLSTCLLATLALGTLGPASADDPCSDPQVRAALRQAEQQWAAVMRQYNSLPSGQRAAIDAAVRDATRGTPYQVNSLSELQRLINVCRNWQSSPPQPTPRPIPAKTPAITPLAINTAVPPAQRTITPAVPQPKTAGRGQDLLGEAWSRVGRLTGAAPARAPIKGPLASAASDGIPEIKPGWQLFSDPNMPDAVAYAKYGQALDQRKAALEANKAAAQKELEANERRSKAFHDSAAAKATERTIEALKEDRKEALAARDAELHSAAVSAVGLAAGGLGAAAGAMGSTNPLLKGAGEVAHAGTGGYELTKFLSSAAQGKPLTHDDWSGAGDGLTSYASAAADLAGKHCGMPAAAAQTTSHLMGAYLAQRWADTAEAGIQQSTGNLQNYSQSLERNKALQTAKAAEYEAQLARLREEREYLNRYAREHPAR